jgi:hypothetical protein
MVLTMVIVVSLLSPDVVISPPAKRVLPPQSFEIATRVSSAFAIERTLSAIAFASSALRRFSAEAAESYSERGLTLFSLC